MREGRERGRNIEREERERGERRESGKEESGKEIGEFREKGRGKKEGKVRLG